MLAVVIVVGSDLAVTRWREDTTRDRIGTFCYIRDTETGSYWSTAYQPTLQKSEHYEAIFLEGRAEFDVVMMISIRIPKSLFHRKMILNFAE